MELPVVAPWLVTEIEPDHISMVRNPYYFKVDIEGNRLPYVDYNLSVLAENVELRAAKVLAGEPDFTRGAIAIKKVPALKMVEEKNNGGMHLTPVHATSGVLGLVHAHA